jgi:biopolymer transport protein ExbD
MAFKLGESNEELKEVSDINVTPFIDVMLVLLIIFMVAAPLSTVDVHVDLPTTGATPQPRPEKPVYVSIKPDRTIVANETVTTLSALPALLLTLTEGRKETRLFVRGDRLVAYGEVMNVMDQLREAGFLKVALVAMERAPQQ